MKYEVNAFQDNHISNQLRTSTDKVFIQGKWV